MIIGDSKGPFEYDLPGAELWTLDRQRSLTFSLQARLPIKHYWRKNLGYLIAIERGAGLIYETDDDNSPLGSWKLRHVVVILIAIQAQHWSNVYRWFSDNLIWPRGLPLEAICDERTFPKAIASNDPVERYAPIQQGLANTSPDVDAVWRLVLDKYFPV